MNQARSSRAPMIQRTLTARLAVAAFSVVLVCVVADMKLERAPARRRRARGQPSGVAYIIRKSRRGGAHSSRGGSPTVREGVVRRQEAGRSCLACRLPPAPASSARTEDSEEMADDEKGLERLLALMFQAHPWHGRTA